LAIALLFCRQSLQRRARLEYDYIGLSSQTFTIPAPGFAGLPAGDQFTGQNRNFQIVNVGINYKFGFHGY
jgi:opacity protein-like surface antigen